MIKNAFCFTFKALFVLKVFIFLFWIFGKMARLEILRLGYYATFIVEKFYLLFYKVNTCLQKTATSIGLQAKQIFTVNNSYMYFFNLQRVFCGFFSKLFSEIPATYDKKQIEINFAALQFHLYDLKKCVSDF